MNANKFDLEQYETHHIPLKYPLLIVKGKKGFLSCAYVDNQICNKTDEAHAVVVGVKSVEDMLNAKLVRVSKPAIAMGVCEGMTGEQALIIFNT